MEELPDLNEIKLSRREFLGHTFRALTDQSHRAALIAPFGLDKQQSYEEEITQFPFELYPQQETQLEFQENSYFDFEQTEYRVDLPQMGWYPDGRIPFITQSDGSKLMWVSGIVNGVQGSYPYTWSPSEGLNRYIGPNGFAPSVSRNQSDYTQYYRNGYSGLTSVIKTNYGLLGFTHDEEWVASQNGAGFRASVGIVVSKDGGLTFERAAGSPILGRRTLYPGGQVTGAGQPCAIKVTDRNTGKNYAYIYYTEWLPRDQFTPNEIYLTKLELQNNGLGAVESWTQSGFKNTINAKAMPNLKPVLIYPRNLANANYSALAGVTFNTKRQKLLAIFETDLGVCATESENGLDWSSAELIIKYPVPLSEVWQNPANSSYSYPSLVDFSKVNDNFTGENLTMLMARGIGQARQHSMVALKLKTKG